MALAEKLSKFQSTPVIANGRIGLVGVVSGKLTDGFNPRPLLLTGESRVPLMFDQQTWTFQSTPVIANGRIRR